MEIGMRWMACLALCGGFGAVEAMCYQGRWVDAIWLHWTANLAAGWLLAAFVCGWLVRSLVGSAVAGLVGTQLALYVFYAVTGETNGAVTNKWIVMGMLSGPVCGWLGHRWAVHRSSTAVLALAGALILEPVGWRVWMGFLPSYTYPVFMTEVLIGIGLAALAVVSRRRGPGDPAHVTRR